jgi:hypothetical protein
MLGLGWLDSMCPMVAGFIGSPALLVKRVLAVIIA